MRQYYAQDLEDPCAYVRVRSNLNPALQRTPSAFGFGSGKKPGSPFGVGNGTVFSNRTFCGSHQAEICLEMFESIPVLAA